MTTPVVMRVWWLLVGAIASVGCSETEPPAACPRKPPPFRLEVTAAGAVPLPEDTEVKVFYGGSSWESFSVAEPNNDNADVCCRLGAMVGGALPEVACDQIYPFDGGAVEAVLCELWTTDLPQVTVSASGYPDLTQTLRGSPSAAEECGLETVDVRLVLQSHDAGIH